MAGCSTRARGTSHFLALLYAPPRDRPGRLPLSVPFCPAQSAIPGRPQGNGKSSPGQPGVAGVPGECGWFWQAVGPGQRRLSETRSAWKMLMMLSRKPIQGGKYCASEQQQQQHAACVIVKQQDVQQIATRPGLADTLFAVRRRGGWAACSRRLSLEHGHEWPTNGTRRDGCDYDIRRARGGS